MLFAINAKSRESSAAKTKLDTSSNASLNCFMTLEELDEILGDEATLDCDECDADSGDVTARTDLL